MSKLSLKGKKEHTCVNCNFYDICLGEGNINFDEEGNCEIWEGKEETMATCRTCKHRQPWEFGSKIIQYCGARKNNRTFNHLLKIKVTNEACSLYKEDKKNG